jgi:hypothetical protein
VVTGLGAVTETYTVLLHRGPPFCTEGATKRLGYPARWAIANKGEIYFAVAESAQCYEQFDLGTATLAFTVTTVLEDKNARHTEVWIQPIAGGASRSMTAPAFESTAPRWSDDGKTLFSRQRVPETAEIRGRCAWTKAVRHSRRKRLRVAQPPAVVVDAAVAAAAETPVGSRRTRASPLRRAPAHRREVEVEQAAAAEGGEHPAA